MLLVSLIMKNDFTTVILKRGSKRTQTKTLSAVDKRLKEEQTIYSKKNTKKKESHLIVFQN
jgi:hypothetical protein